MERTGQIRGVLNLDNLECWPIRYFVSTKIGSNAHQTPQKEVTKTC